MFLAFGLVMEFPILLVGLSRVGIITSARLSGLAPDGHPRHRDLRRGRDPRRRPGQPVRPRRDDVRPVRADRSCSSGAAGGDRRGRTSGRGRTRSAEPAVVIVSGLSGGGKTAAAKLFEDLGYTVVDNLPGELLPDLAELVSSDRERFARVAIVLDVRAGDATLALAAMRGALEGRGIRPRVVFLEASDEVLIRRFSETRHRHPLGDERGIASSIAEERRHPRAGPRRVRRRRSTPRTCRCASCASGSSPSWRPTSGPDQLAIQLISFGFKYGVPLEADLVFDVRFMQNPYYVAELRPAVRPDRRGPRVRPRPAGRRRASSRSCEDFLDFAIPAYIAEGKTRLTIGIGCTGGYHRSIVVAEELAAWLRERGLRAGRGLPPGARPDVNLRRWLTPGIGIKRWLLVVFAGLLLLALAFAHFLRQITRDLEPGGPAGTLIDALTLQFLPFAAARAHRRRRSALALVAIGVVPGRSGR